MSINITISLPFETIADLQAYTAGCMPCVTASQVTQAASQAAKALPIKLAEMGIQRSGGKPYITRLVWNPPSSDPHYINPESDESNSAMRLNVKTLLGEILEMQVRSSWKIEDMKQIIAQMTVWEPSQQRLIFAGEQLQDGLRFDDYNNIQGDSTLHLVLRLTGS